MEGLIVRVPTGLDVLVRLKGLPARELEIDFVLPQLEVEGGGRRAEGVKGKVHIFRDKHRVRESVYVGR